jgi:hypothetical protein
LAQSPHAFPLRRFPAGHHPDHPKKRQGLLGKRQCGGGTPGPQAQRDHLHGSKDEDCPNGPQAASTRQCVIPSAQDSPTNKLLYAKEIPEYRKIVQRYYRQIQDMTPLSEQEMNAHLAEESRVGAGVGVLVPKGWPRLGLLGHCHNSTEQEAQHFRAAWVPLRLHQQGVGQNVPQGERRLGLGVQEASCRR